MPAVAMEDQAGRAAGHARGTATQPSRSPSSLGGPRGLRSPLQGRCGARSLGRPTSRRRDGRRGGPGTQLRRGRRLHLVQVTCLVRRSRRRGPGRGAIAAARPVPGRRTRAWTRAPQIDPGASATRPSQRRGHLQRHDPGRWCGGRSDRLVGWTGSVRHGRRRGRDRRGGPGVVPRRHGRHAGHGRLVVAILPREGRDRGVDDEEGAEQQRGDAAAKTRAVGSPWGRVPTCRRMRTCGGRWGRRRFIGGTPPGRRDGPS